ncbi:MAG: hypothetical protein ABIR11_11080 [Candidatus Limnocylindrales bacterium]
MRLPADIALVVFVAAGVLGFRRYRNSLSVVAVVAGASLLIVDLIRVSPRVVVEFDLLDVLLVFPFAVVIAQLTGRPDPIARRVGFGARNRQWEFDRQLVTDTRRMDAAFARHPPERTWPAYRRWQADVSATVGSSVRHLESLHPPDEQWREIRDGYVSLYKGIADRIARHEVPDDEGAWAHGLRLKEASDRLRREYRLKPPWRW